MRRCGACDARQEEDAQFCSTCGAYLGWADDVQATRAPAPAPDPEDPAPPAASPPVPEATRRTTGPPAADGRAAGPAEPRPPSEVRGPGRDGSGGAPGGLLAQAHAGLQAARRLAEAQDRTDLLQRLDTTQERLTARAVPIVTVGEFKRGKSTLVNALLRRWVCPVDADIVTAVPTLVRYAETAGATAYYEPEADDDGDAPVSAYSRPLALQDVEQVVSELGPPPPHGRPSSVEIRLPHPLLRGGLQLVDTPGVGGLDSAHGVVTLGALDGAGGVLFVTDASQELTAPEMRFLQMVLERCPHAALVLTKTDLHPHWRRIVELDRAHLARAGSDIPVFAVSSLLRLQPEQDADLVEESGFRPLLAFLAARVAAGAELAAGAAVGDVRFVTGQLARQVDGERQVLSRPAQSDALIRQLATTEARTGRLASPSAGWQQALGDRVQDLTTDVDHELADRIRSLTRDVEEVIDRGDPKDTWPEVEAWLRRGVAAAAVDTYATMRARAQSVVSEVASLFELEAAPVDVDVEAPIGRVDEIDLGTPDVSGIGGRMATALNATRSGSFAPTLIFIVAGAVPGLGLAGASIFLGPIGLALGTAMGVKAYRDERARQLTHRRQLAKAKARQYLDEVSFRVGKDLRDSLRLLQRRLRDEFQDRALAMHRSSQVTVAAARSAASLGEAERAARATRLAARSAELRRLQHELAVASGAAPVPVGRRA